MLTVHIDVHLSETFVMWSTIPASTQQLVEECIYYAVRAVQHIIYHILMVSHECAYSGFCQQRQCTSPEGRLTRNGSLPQQCISQVLEMLVNLFC